MLPVGHLVQDARTLTNEALVRSSSPSNYRFLGHDS